jgi:electron-transferring-flavoprotein dehydrogenase
MEREQLEVDVLFVGAGPANLSSALHLSLLVKKHNREVQSGEREGLPIDEPVILVVEKGREIGSHALSGAVVDPRGFDELLASLPGREPPYDAPVSDDALYILTKSNAYRSPITPPPLQNHGYYIASLGKLVRWLSELCEEKGVEVYPGFPAVELILDNDRVAGVRTGDQGRDKDGSPKSNFEPGIDVLAKVTVLGEGPRGTLSRQAFHRLGLRDNSHPQIYAVGVKELWQLSQPLEPGLVYHSMGYPTGIKELGGGFIYTAGPKLLDIGFVVGLDYRNPHTDCHSLLQKLKQHPFVEDLLKDGKPISYGAKAIPEGGLYSMPKLYSDGLLITGDSAGFLNSQRLKGIHLAVKSGMLAAETIAEALLSNDFSASLLSSYKTRFDESWARRELYKVRNFRQSFQRGFLSGMAHTGLQFLTGGRGVKDPMPTAPGHTRMKLLKDSFDEIPAKAPRVRFDGKLTFDKLDDVFLSDTSHEEDQPCHLKILEPDICSNRCTSEYGNPCQHFCPTGVYELIKGSKGETQLQVNFTNCVHCKTCDIMDPYQIVLWTPPEGGGGPAWKKM